MAADLTRTSTSQLPTLLTSMSMSPRGGDFGCQPAARAVPPSSHGSQKLPDVPPTPGRRSLTLTRTATKLLQAQLEARREISSSYSKGGGGAGYTSGPIVEDRQAVRLSFERNMGLQHLEPKLGKVPEQRSVSMGYSGPTGGSMMMASRQLTIPPASRS